MPVKVAEEWFAICGGCEVTILDIGEPILDLLPNLEFVHMPVLMDHKYYGQTGEKTELEIPEADIGIISGSVRTEEHKLLLKEMRDKVKTLIAIGSCACYGGVPALGNMYVTDSIYDKVYRETKGTDPGETPSDYVPKLTDSVQALDELVKIDVYLPGCPTTPEMVRDALTALLEGKPFELPERSVCDDCPVIREKKSMVQLKRPLEPIDGVGEPIEKVRCILEQGYLCVGPVTKSGCGGDTKVPRCVRAYMPCRGCFGPIRKTANPMVDMVGALSSIGLSARGIVDRRATLNRFVGGQKRLRPLPGR